jgi:hypothetical protein
VSRRDDISRIALRRNQVPRAAEPVALGHLQTGLSICSSGQQRGLRNDLGLLSEEYDLQTRRLVGNFPQSFSHVGLINTACRLTQAGGPAEDQQSSIGHQS